VALLKMHGFEGAPDVSPGISTNSGSIVAVTGRDGVGKAIQNGSTAGASILIVPVGSAVSTLIVQFAAKVNLAVQGGSTLEGSKLVSLLGDSGATTHLTITIDATNKLQLRRGGPTGTVIATETGVRSDATWVYLEIKATVDDAVGTCIVRANGVEVINFTGDTKNAGTATTLDTLSFGFAGNLTAHPIDDLIIMDSTGSTMNDFMGDHVIKGLRANGNGAANQWTGSDGDSTDNYLLSDELPFSSTDYVGDFTPGNQDIYAFEDLSITGTVRAVRPLLYAAKTDAGIRSVKALKRATSGTIVGSSDLALSTTYAILDAPIWETDADGTAWTVAKVNSAQFGVQTV
jgi:hypothetical protein